MSPEEIRLELFKRRKEVTQSSIARSLGVSHPLVVHVIDRKAVSKRVMQAIADAIQYDIRYVFPERFFKNAPNNSRLSQL